MLHTSSSDKKKLRCFCMQWFARLVECRFLEEMKELVLLGRTVFVSQYQSEEVAKSLRIIQRRVEEFPAIPEHAKLHLDVELTHFENEDDDKEFLQFIASENGALSKQKKISKNSDLDEFWAQSISNLPKSKITRSNVKNQFYFPAYFEDILHHKLPTATLWSGLCLGNLKRFSTNYKMDTPLSNERNSLCQNATSAQVEGYFSNLKRNQGLRQPIQNFIQNTYTDLLWHQRRYFDGILEGHSNSLIMEMSQKELKSFIAIDKGKPTSKDANIRVKQIEAQWNKRRKCSSEGTSKLGVYRSTRNKKLSFAEPKSETSPTLLDKKAFNLFTILQWRKTKEITATPAACEDKLRHQWLQMSKQEKKRYSDMILKGNKNETEECIVCNAKVTSMETVEDWVCCDLCGFWSHCLCAGTEIKSMNAVEYYHCDTCISDKFIPFLRYLSYHATDSINIQNNSDVANIFQNWHGKSSEEKHAITEQPVAEKHKYSLDIVLVTSMRGIENRFQNCWLNSIVQVVCGSSIFDLFPIEHLPNDLIATQLNLLHYQLKGVDKSKHPKSLKIKSQKDSSIEEWVILLTNMIGADINTAEQHDAMELYDALVDNINGNLQQIGIYNFRDSVMFNLASITMCKYCGQAKGSIEEKCTFQLKVPISGTAMNITSLLRNAAYGSYSFNSLNITCGCTESPKYRNKKEMYHELSVMLDAPTLFVINTDRTMLENRNALVQTPIIIEEEITLNCCAKKKPVGASDIYVLAAVVNHYGQTPNSGHYTSTVFTKNSAITFDDEKKTVKRKKSVLQDEHFMLSTHMLFYTRKVLPTSNITAKEELWNVAHSEKSIIEKIWFGDVEIGSNQIDTNDLRTACHGRWLNGDIITAFLREVSARQSGLNSYVYDTQFYTTLEQQRPTIELEQYTRRNLFEYDIALIPIHHKSVTNEDRHWSIVGVYFREKVVCHCDSLLSLAPEIHSTVLSFIQFLAMKLAVPFKLTEWTLVSPNDICRQENGVDCGVYTCLNGYCLLRKIYCEPKIANDCYEARYWIASIAHSHMYAKPVANNRRKQISMNVDPDIVPVGNILRSKEVIFGCRKLNYTDVQDQRYDQDANTNIEETLIISEKSQSHCRTKRQVKKSQRCQRLSCNSERLKENIAGTS